MFFSLNVFHILIEQVAKQREQYRLLQKGQHSFLTPYRLEKLNEVGFCWAARTSANDPAQQEAAAAVRQVHERMQDFPQKHHPHHEPIAEEEAAVDEALGEVSKEDFVLRDGETAIGV